MSRQWNRTTLLRVAMAPAMLGLLAACSDSEDRVEPPPTFRELANESLTLAEEVDGLEETVAEDLPTSGKASYEGVMLIGAEDGLALAGEMEMNVNFGDRTDPISGQVSNIVDSGNERYDGTLDISNSYIDPDANPEFEAPAGADLSGTLTDSSDEEFDVDGELEIGFAGSPDDEVSHAGGLVDGTACNGGDCTTFEGGFVLSR